MRLLFIFVALLLSSSALVACGDDDDEALSKSEYIKRGNAICAQWAREFNRLFEEGFPTTQSAVTRFFVDATPLFRERMSSLRALDPPEADEDRIEAFLASGDRAVSDFERASRDPKFASRVFDAEGGKNEADFTRKAQAYGLAKCEEEDEEDDEAERKLDPATFPADKRAFVRRLDARCRESNRKSSALEERYLKRFPPPVSGWAKFLPRIVELIRADLRFARGLTPPAADRARIDELLDKQDVFADKLERAGKAAADNDERTVNRLTQEAFSESEELDAEIRRYGFQVCGSEDEDEEDE